MGSRCQFGFRGHAGGAVPTSLRSQTRAVSSEVRTGTKSARGAEQRLSAGARTHSADGSTPSAVQSHGRSLLSGRSRARSGPADASVMAPDRHKAILVLGAPPGVADLTGTGLG